MDGINNYEIIRELGRNREGGRISYLATDNKCEQKVVIKQFRFIQDNSSWQGFKIYQREIEILQQIDHPRIPQYLDSFETEDGFCMVQEYKNAPCLAQNNSFSDRQIKQILISILEILVDLQQRIPPILHRDIKPENILIDEEDRAYLIDFGLARVHSQDLAMSSVIAGTPGFIPPEELFNRPLTKASDLYSLGATEIALITNTPASKLSNLIDDNYQFQYRHLVKGINPDFLAWLDKMVTPNLQDRFADAKVALDRLKEIDITGLPAIALSKKPPNPREIDLVSCSIFLLLTWAISFIAFKPESQTTSQNDNKTDTQTRPISQTQKQSLTEEQQWFQNIKSRCNAVEVVTAMKNTNYPSTVQGVGYAASCYALAGRIDLADKIIQELPQNQQVYAAEVVFHIGHPVADAGDDRSAGPIMDLVLRYWPQNYMAVYHAGMSAYVLDDYSKAQRHLLKFLRIYQRQDYWTSRAKQALDRMERGIPADASFSVHH